MPKLSLHKCRLKHCNYIKVSWMIIVYCQLIEINIPVPKFTPAVLSLCCISPCSCLLFLFLLLLLLFHNSVWIHSLLLPNRMLQNLSLEQKGSGPSLRPPAFRVLSLSRVSNSSPVPLCLTPPNLHNKSVFKCMPPSWSSSLAPCSGVFVVKLKNQFKVSTTLTHHIFTHSDSCVLCATSVLQCEECVRPAVSQAGLL